MVVPACPEQRSLAIIRNEVEVHVLQLVCKLVLFDLEQGHVRLSDGRQVRAPRAGPICENHRRACRAREPRNRARSSSFQSSTATTAATPAKGRRTLLRSIRRTVPSSAPEFNDRPRRCTPSDHPEDTPLHRHGLLTAAPAFTSPRAPPVLLWRIRSRPSTRSAARWRSTVCTPLEARA